MCPTPRVEAVVCRGIFHFCTFVGFLSLESTFQVFWGVVGSPAWPRSREQQAGPHKCCRWVRRDPCSPLARGGSGGRGGQVTHRADSLHAGEWTSARLGSQTAKHGLSSCPLTELARPRPCYGERSGGGVCLERVSGQWVQEGGCACGPLRVQHGEGPRTFVRRQAGGHCWLKKGSHALWDGWGQRGAA